MLCQIKTIELDLGKTKSCKMAVIEDPVPKRDEDGDDCSAASTTIHHLYTTER